jgi:MFS family permease
MEVQKKNGFLPPGRMMTVGSDPKLSICSGLNFRGKSKDEEDEEEVNVPQPPDGGWGWVVVFASFMCNLILDGIAYTFGLLLKPLVDDFESDASTISWVGSLLCGVYMLSGPIVGGLVNKFGCRPVCMLGAVLSWIAFSVSTLSVNVGMLMVTYGIIGGFGFGLIYLPAIVSVGFYFESKRALATGISVCGSGVGTFVFAPLASFLLDAFGWKTSNLIFAAVCLLCVIFGAMMRPLEEIVEEEEYEGQLTMELPDGTKVPSSPANLAKRNSIQGLPSIRSVGTMPKIAENEAYEPHLEEGDIEEENYIKESPKKKTNIKRNLSVNSTVTNGKINRNFSTPHLRPIQTRQDSMRSTGSTNSLRASSTKIARPMSRIDIFYTGSIRNIDDEDFDDIETVGLRPNRQSYVSIGGMKGSQGSQVFPRNSLIDTGVGEIEEKVEDSGIVSVLRTMLNPTILKDPKFLLLGISNVFGFLGFYVPFVYLPSLASSHEAISTDQAALLLSIIGISNTLGRIISGYMSDFCWVDSLFVVNCSLVLSSICVFIFPLVTTFASFVILGLLFGLFIAAYISLTSIVLVDVMGIENLTSAFGLLTMFRGAASIVGPPTAGAVYEATHSYSISFYLAGGFLLAAGVTSVLADIVRRSERAAGEPINKTEKL